MKSTITTQSLLALLLVTTFSCSPQFIDPQAAGDAAALPKSNVSVRSFDQVNETMSALTGVNIASLPARNVTSGGVTTVGNDFIRPEGGGLKFELPSNNSLAEFNSSHQGAIVRMAAIYCDQFIDHQTAGSAGRPDSVANLNNSIDSIVEDYYGRFWGTCAVKPDLNAAQMEVKDLLADLQGQMTNSADNYLKLTCSVFLSSSCVTMF